MLEKTACFLIVASLFNSLSAIQYRVPAKGSTPEERVESRRVYYEKCWKQPLDLLGCIENRVGTAEQFNCENMCGQIVVPIGMISHLMVPHSNGRTVSYAVPIATTEGALIAGLNRGAKALSAIPRIQISSEYVGATRAPVFHVTGDYSVEQLEQWIGSHKTDLQGIAKSTSSHIDLLNVQVFKQDPYLFLRCCFDTDMAMGMNMATLASRAIADYIQLRAGNGNVRCCALSSNMCTDKKPSRLTAELGRGYKVKITALITNYVLRTVLKTTKEDFYRAWEAKHDLGSRNAGLLGNNGQAANVISALYIALGQDPAHVVEGSLSRLTAKLAPRGVEVTLELPALMVGVIGGGTTLPAQRQLLSFLRLDRSDMHPCATLAELIGLSVLAGEISLLAALSSGDLARAHSRLARGIGRNNEDE